MAASQLLYSFLHAPKKKETHRGPQIDRDSFQYMSCGDLLFITLLLVYLFGKYYIYI